MARSSPFCEIHELSADEHARLTAAYEQAFNELITVHGYCEEQLAKAIEPMKFAILAMHRAGQRDNAQIVRYAAFKAVTENQQR